MVERQVLPVSPGSDPAVYERGAAEANLVPHSPEQDLAASRTLHLHAPRRTGNDRANTPQPDQI